MLNSIKRMGGLFCMICLATSLSGCSHVVETVNADSITYQYSTVSAVVLLLVSLCGFTIAVSEIIMSITQRIQIMKKQAKRNRRKKRKQRRTSSREKPTRSVVVGSFIMICSLILLILSHKVWTERIVVYEDYFIVRKAKATFSSNDTQINFKGLQSLSDFLGIVPLVGRTTRNFISPQLQVTSWVPKGSPKDLNSGRWVQIGGDSIENWIKTGLWGGKVNPSNYNWIKPNAAYESITGVIDKSNLVLPSGIRDLLKGLFLGQRRIK